MQNNPTQHLTIGKTGEDEAAEYLINAGFKIVSRNWRYKNHHEIDIICKSPDGDIIAVEVKTHDQPNETAPFEMVTPAKIHRIKQSLEMFIREEYAITPALRVDVISIILHPFRIEHFVGVE
ncbi:YraN family protein [candidate division WWE3 bacterium]|nr:YraN family protein [candidate division WWE3 bacterium]